MLVAIGASFSARENATRSPTDSFGARKPRSGNTTHFNAAPNRKLLVSGIYLNDLTLKFINSPQN